MKLTLHSFEDLERLLALLGPRSTSILRDKDWEPLTGEQLLTDLGNACKEMDENRRMARGETVEGRMSPVERVDPLPMERVEPETESSPSLPEEAAAAPELDADGRRHDERIDSSSKALTAKGVWRARRNHGYSDEEVEAIKREATPDKDAEPEPEDEAPAVTETHPLPVDEPDAVAAEQTSDPVIDFEAIVAAAQKPAEDISDDGIGTTLKASQAFTKAFSPSTFQQLREVVAPGKTLATMTPGERRVLLAAMKLCNEGDAEG